MIGEQQKKSRGKLPDSLTLHRLVGAMRMSRRRAMIYHRMMRRCGGGRMYRLLCRAGEGR